MKFKRKQTQQHSGRTAWLILFSLLLLCVSQVLWLKKVWREQQEALQQRTNYLFQNTMIRLQDSLVVHAMKQGGKPAMLDGLPKVRIDTTSMAGIKCISDTLRTAGHLFSKTELRHDWAGENQVRVMVSVSDSQMTRAPRGLGRFLLRLNQDSSGKLPPDFVFEFQKDTLSEESLRTAFAAALDSAGLPVHFALKYASNPGPPHARARHLMTTEFMPAGVLNLRFFAAELQQYDPYLLRKTLPSALFSLLLFGLISIAFYLISQNLKRQQQLAQQKNEFISNVTHELKTPLTTVGVALEALQDFQVWQQPEKAREYLHISKLELERLNLLVEKVLRLSMFEQEALTMRPEPLELGALVHQVVDAMRLQASNLGVELHCSIPDHAAFMVNGDRLHLTGVIYNLLDNAFKYRGENPGVFVSLAMAYVNNKPVARLRVQDNGSGIAPEYQQQIFEKFFRVPTGNTHNVKGHGLGLAYVSEVLHRHNGSIHVESRPGEGSTFTVEIPVATHASDA